MTEVLTHFGHRYRTHGNMLCPWHQEKNPSARLYEEQNTIWCWTCAPNHGVDVVEFVVIELGLEEDSPTRGVAVLKALDYLEEHFGTSYEGIPWQNRFTTSLHKLNNRAASFDPKRYWSLRHIQILRILASVENSSKWAVYDYHYLILRDLLNADEDVQSPAWHSFASALSELN